MRRCNSLSAVHLLTDPISWNYEHSIIQINKSSLNRYLYSNCIVSTFFFDITFNHFSFAKYIITYILVIVLQCFNLIAKNFTIMSTIHLHHLDKKQIKPKILSVLKIKYSAIKYLKQLFKKMWDTVRYR